MKRSPYPAIVSGLSLAVAGAAASAAAPPVIHDSHASAGERTTAIQLAQGDRLVGGSGLNTLIGGSGDDSIGAGGAIKNTPLKVQPRSTTGGSASPRVAGSSDTLIGGSGDDTLSIGAGGAIKNTPLQVQPRSTIGLVPAPAPLGAPTPSSAGMGLRTRR
jgi:Ca2+-binding RTX toxin-like protein